MRLLSLVFWQARRMYLNAVLVRIPPAHPESWITVSEIADIDRRISRIHAQLSL